MRVKRFVTWAGHEIAHQIALLAFTVSNINKQKQFGKEHDARHAIRHLVKQPIKMPSSSERTTWQETRLFSLWQNLNNLLLQAKWLEEQEAMLDYFAQILDMSKPELASLTTKKYDPNAPELNGRKLYWCLTDAMNVCQATANVLKRYGRIKESEEFNKIVWYFEEELGNGTNEVASS
ncbi:hypothetical protein K470DRAFT_271338 [Piedraia hortae CBS 480.64]|uniref:Uncharacterized protein n=1 Tax=Piedraia hortae CBS 480.64 TaxID=1314780 RepID=A0A6A7BYZ8_9PEZI|nr:hypothetical protein K470DRAFT_271338 [Piedraia hortae CBS 480.64]